MSLHPDPPPSGYQNPGMIFGFVAPGGPWTNRSLDDTLVLHFFFSSGVAKLLSDFWKDAFHTCFTICKMDIFLTFLFSPPGMPWDSGMAVTFRS